MSNIGDIMFLHEWEDARDMFDEQYGCDCGNMDCKGCEMGDSLAEAHVDESKIKKGETHE